MSPEHERVITLLECGRNAQWRPKGNSMLPRIKSGQLVTLEPVYVHDPPVVDDVVMCRVEGRILLHKITATERAKNGTLRFQISNNKGHVNGWTTKVWGRVIKVED